MKKILFGLVLVLFGIFSLSFEAYMGDGLWSIFNLSPFIGVGFGIWGLLEKDK